MDLTVNNVPSRMLPVIEGIILTIRTQPGAQSDRRLVPAGLTLTQTLENQGMGGTGWEVCASSGSTVTETTYALTAGSNSSPLYAPSA